MNFIGKWLTPDNNVFFYFTHSMFDVRNDKESYDLSGFELYYPGSSLDEVMKNDRWMYKDVIEKMWEVDNKLINKLQKKAIRIIFKK
jgi:hypothetical protein